jgi:glycosyltransferase involved in cell wall biosynthesis
MKLEPDPGFESSEIQPEDVKKYHIQFVEKWGSREDYWDTLNQCNVYIAPRVTEGIGMSFLEAMAMGIAVAAADKPTMNEYISHGDNGFLFDMSNLQPLDFSDAAAVGQRGRDSISALEKQFQDELMSAVTKVLSASNAKRTILVPLMAMGAQLRSNRKLRLAYRKIRYLSVKN